MLLFLANNSFAQIKDGRKVLTSVISSIGVSSFKGEASSSVNPTLNYETSGIGFTTEIAYGKIKKDNLFSYGLHLALGFSKNSNNSTSDPIDQKNHRIEFGPVLNYQKFFSITDKLYYSPFSRLNINYHYAKQGATSTSSASFEKGIAGSLAFYPFSITFSKDPKTNFLFTIGTVSIDYSRAKYYTKPALNDSKLITSAFNTNAQLAGIGFGLQKLF